MDKAESKETPRLFTLDQKGIRQPAKSVESVGILDSTDGFPGTIASVLSSFSFGLFFIVQSLMSSIHEDNLSYISASWAGRRRGGGFSVVSVKMVQNVKTPDHS